MYTIMLYGLSNHHESFGLEKSRQSSLFFMFVEYMNKVGIGNIIKLLLNNGIFLFSINTLFKEFQLKLYFII